MKNWTAMLAICAVLAIPAWAQHGGGGGHGGMGGGVGHGGGMSGGHGGFAHGSGFSGASHGGWNGGWNGGWHGGGWGWRGSGLRGYGYWGGRWGWGYPYWGWGYAGWYPSSGYWGDYGYDYGYSYSPEYDYGATQYPVYAEVAPPYGYGSSTASYATRDEVLQIQSEIARLKEQQAQRSGVTPQPSRQTPTMLVFRDGHTETVQNYGIAGSTLWILDPTHARKVPLSSIDLPATKRDNEDRGVNFSVPGSR